jgi:hypothetical protein
LRDNADKLHDEPISTRTFEMSVAEAEKRGLHFEDGEFGDYVTDGGQRFVVRARLVGETWHLTVVRAASNER